MSPSRPSREEARTRWGEGRGWWLLVGGLLLFSSLSAGFFLYATVVVAAAMGIATVWANAAARGLRARRQLSAEQIELGESVESELTLSHAGSWPVPWLFWRDQVDEGLDVEGATADFLTLHGGASVNLSSRLHSTRRGLFRVGPAVIEASDPFGLVRRFEVASEANFVTVLPRRLALGEGWPLGQRPAHEVPRRRSLYEDPSRFRGVREYHSGDSLRHIHWRATARSGRLQIKLFEPSVLQGVLLAVEMGPRAYGGPVETAEVTRELAVTTAASLAELVLLSGQQVGLISNGLDAAERYPDEWTGGSFRQLDEAVAAAGPRLGARASRPLQVAPAKGDWQLDRLLQALARLESSGGSSLPELLTAELPRLPRSLVWVVITPRVSPELALCAEAWRRSGIDALILHIEPAQGSEVIEEPESDALPAHVPLVRIGSDEDLEHLGAAGL